MTEQRAERGPASYFPSIERKYGESIDHWISLIRTRQQDVPETRHSDLVGWLKDAHGLGHGHANALVAYVRAS